MPISSAELAKRLVEADRRLCVLRRATLDLRRMGDAILEERGRGSHRPRRDGTPRR